MTSQASVQKPTPKAEALQLAGDDKGYRRNLPTRKFSENQAVFRERENGREAFIIRSGTVEIFKTVMEDGVSQEISLATIGPGSIFGEMALIDDQPRMAKARAIDGPLAVYVVSKEQFESLLGKADSFVNRLIEFLTTNARSTGEKMKA